MEGLADVLGRVLLDDSVVEIVADALAVSETGAVSGFVHGQ
jgi:hypothetical protein